MKFKLSLFVLLCSCLYAKAQTENLLPVDEKGKFIYYEVVELKNTAKDSLKNKAVVYFKKMSKDLKFKTIIGDTAIMATGKIIIDKTLLVMSHPSGEILYTFETEVRDGKYRFWLSNFGFIPYQRDRYGNFVANTTIATPLETDPGKLNAAQWKEYQLQIAKYAKSLASKFKLYMASKSQNSAAPITEKKVVNKSW